MKRMIGWFLCLAIVLGIGGGLCVNVSAASEPYVTHSLPKTMKVGASLRDLPDTVVHYHHLTPGKQVVLNEIDYIGLNKIAVGDHAGDGPWDVIVDKEGNANSRSIARFIYRVYRPGIITYQPGYYYADTKDEIYNGTPISIGDPIRIIVEEPIITHNAPSTIKVGSNLTLKTELTNTALTNKKVSEYTEEIEHDTDPHYIPNNDNIHTVAYRPIVEVVEGQSLVKQSGQDYTNTLHTSETLSFYGAGTVKLKVTYRQINTCCLITEKRDTRYNPEKTITIKVTDNTVPPTSSTTASSGTTTSSENSTSSSSSASTSSTTSDITSDTTSSTGVPVTTIDEETGIQLEAEPGVVPPDTVIQAEEVKDGGNFVIINNALEQTSDKWVAYDISLISNQAEIQPNGNVKITIPRPKGLNMNKMVLYHVADDGTLTQIPFTMDKTKDNLIFETDHFSLYAVVESETAVNNPNPAEDNHTGLWIIVSAVILVLLIGAGGAVWFFKFRKKPSENEK